jgi:uncharacterized protein YjdB
MKINFLAMLLCGGLCGEFISCGRNTVNLDKSTLSLFVGEEQILASTVEPNDAANRIWTNSDETIVSINDSNELRTTTHRINQTFAETVVLTAVATGTATITVKTGNQTATCIVTVETNRKQ